MTSFSCRPGWTNNSNQGGRGSIRRFLEVAFGLGLALCIGSAAEKENRLGGTEKAMKRANAFTGSILSVEEAAPDEKESQSLDAILEASRVRVTEAPIEAKSKAAARAHQDEIASLETFVATAPASPWTPSLRANLGKYQRLHGRHSLALEHWEAAWEATKHYRSGHGKMVADFVLAHWTRLLASLGRYESLESIFNATRQRALDDGPLSQMWSRTYEAFRQMRSHPGLSYQCGTYALDAVARQGRSKHNSVALLEIPSPSAGFTMKKLNEISEQIELGLVAVERQRTEELIVPSVIHWRQNHFGAIVRQQGDFYVVVDPTFEDPQHLTAEEINAEASGYFLIRRDQFKPGWRELTSVEAERVYGRGNPNFMADANDQVCMNGCPPGCPAGAMPAASHGEAPCEGCGTGGEEGPGMVGWSVSEPYLNLWLRDEPLGYKPAIGDRVSLILRYKQRDEFATPGSIFNFGKSWQSGWLSYVDTISGTPPTSAVYVNLPGGGRSRFDFTNGEAINYYNNLRLRVLTSSGNVTGYELVLADGRKIVYDFFRTYPDGSWPHVFMSKQIDAQGRQTRFNYPNYDPNSFGVRLEEVIDPDNRVTRLYYETNFSYWHDMVTRVVDPFGRTARFTYLETGQLREIEDVAGIKSRLDYGTYGWPTTLTTPYGVTSFTMGGEPMGTEENIDRNLIITVPGGGRHIYAYFHFCDNPAFAPYLPAAYPAAEVPQSTPIGTLDNGPGRRNSFYWGPRQSAGLPAMLAEFTNVHYRKARMRHWLSGTDSYGLRKSVEALSIEREPSPDSSGSAEGQKTWYDYVGKLGGDPSLTGTQSLPSVIARRLPDGSTWYEYYQRDGWGRPLSVTSTYGSGSGTRVNSFAYDANGNLIQEEGPSGLMASYEYDNPYHQVSRVTRYVDATTSYVTTFSYDSATRLLRTINHPNGTATDLIYNTENRLNTRKLRTSPGDVEINRETFTYYANGLIQSHTDERGLSRIFTWDNLQRVTRIDYSSGGFETVGYTLASELQPGLGLNILDPTSFTDRLGNATTFTYNGLRQRTSVRNARDYTTNLGYCACGALETITDALSQTTTFQYDNTGRQTAIIYPGGTMRSYRYNLLGQPTDLLDNSGNVVATYSYNNQGLVATVTNPSGQAASVSYDAGDRPVTINVPGGPTVTLNYDRLGRITSRGYSGGGTETFQYSANGLIQHTDAMGKVTQRSYDLANRKITVTNAKNETTQFFFNAAGDLVTLVDGKNQTTSWIYDAAGRLTSKTDSSGTALMLGYDANDRMTSRWSPAKGWTYFAYDAVGNLASINYPTSTDISYGYDALDRLVSMGDGTGNTTFSYTAFEALAEENSTLSNDTVSFLYDQNRRRSRLSVTKPDGSLWNQDYAYDSASRLRTISSPAGTFTYSYAGAGDRVSQIALPNGASINQSFDTLGRLTETLLRHSNGGTLNVHGYQYNNSHRRTRQSRNGSFVNYAYDDAGQLSSASGYENAGATRWHEQMSYNFDAAGNLTQRWNDALRQDFTPGSRNQISSAGYSGTLTVAGMTAGVVNSVSVNGVSATRYSDDSFAVRGLGISGSYTASAQGAAGNTATDSISGNFPASISLIYDSNGNLTSDGSSAFYYDDENQLIQVTVSGAGRVEYSYDGLKRKRFRREFDAGGGLVKTVRYLYDGLTVVQERDGNDQLVATYTRGLDLSGGLEGAGGIGGLLARTDNSASAYYHSDGGGNVTMLVNSSQQIVAKYLYDPFGNLLGMSGPLADANKYRFSSKEYDDKAGTYYYGFRFYEPNLQRWLNRDPIGEEGGINLYGFVANSPINTVDAFGLFSPGAHDFLYKYPFAEVLPESEIAIMQEAGKAFDKRTQSPSESYLHSMRQRGQSPAEAIRLRNKFILDTLNGARKIACSDRRRALELYAEAMHPVHDSYSPLHRDKNGGPKVWNPLWPFGHSPVDWLGSETIHDIPSLSREEISDYMKKAYHYVFGK